VSVCRHIKYILFNQNVFLNHLSNCKLARLQNIKILIQEVIFDMFKTTKKCFLVLNRPCLNFPPIKIKMLVNQRKVKSQQKNCFSKEVKFKNSDDLSELLNEIKKLT
jgi:hypothetical protein